MLSITEILRRVAPGISINEIDPTFPIIESLEIDSIDLARLAYYIEDEYNVVLDETMLGSITYNEIKELPHWSGGLS